MYVSFVIENKSKILSYIKAVEEYVWKKMIMEGKKIEGLKIVKGRGKRILKKDFKHRLLKLDYDLHDFVEPDKFLPLTKIEKLIKKEDTSKIINYQEGKETIVPVSDKRPEYNSAEDDF